MILFFSMIRRPLRCTLFPYTTLFRSVLVELGGRLRVPSRAAGRRMGGPGAGAGLGSGRVGRRLGAEAPQLVVRAGGSVRGPRRGGVIAGRRFAGGPAGAALEAHALEQHGERG